MAKVLRDYLRDAAQFLTAPPGEPETKGWSPLATKASAARTADYASRIGVEHYPPRKYRELYGKYRTNPIVRRCTKLCAEAVAMLEPIVRIDGKENAGAAQAISKWFKQPNPLQDRFAFTSELASFFKLSGDGWVEGVQGATPDYLEQYPLRPERMGIKPGPNGWPLEYVYRSWSGQSVRMQGMPDAQAEEILTRWRRQGRTIGNSNSRLLHIKDFSSDDDLFGSGALEACEGALDTYENAEQLARAALKNGAVLSGMISYEPNVPAGATAPVLTEGQKADLKKQMRERTGAKNAGKWLLAQGGLKWVPMSQSLVDLQAEEIRNNAARDICRAFGVPSILLGIPGDMTFANFEEASRAFYRNTVFADATRIYGGLAAWWSQLTKIPGLELYIDEEKVWALAEELERLWARVESAQSLSFQEKRAALGYDELPARGDLMASPMGGFATVEELVANDYGLFGPRMTSVVGDEPAPEGETQKLPPPKK